VLPNWKYNPNKNGRKHSYGGIWNLTIREIMEITMGLRTGDSLTLILKITLTTITVKTRK
jgi:hypothetical protein